MKDKNVFIKSTLYLIIGGFFTKCLGFIIKIIYTRIIGTEGISLYSLVLPTYSMLLTITSLSLPISLSKLVAEKKKRSLHLMSNAFYIIIIVNIVVILIMVFFSDYIAKILLHEPKCASLLIAMAFTLPFVSISSIIKGYFNGLQKTLPYMISNILEQILRLIIIIIIIPILYQKSVLLAVKGIILLSIISEAFSIFIFTLFIPKKVKIDIQTIKYNLETKKEILNIAIPTVSGKVIGNIGYFLEPIILTNLLLLNGFDLSYIIREYGVYNAYSISLLTMPAFFIAALSNTIIPEISKYKEERKTSMIKRRIIQSLLFTLIIGIIFSIFIVVFRIPLLNILYQTVEGEQYIKLLAPFFCLFYLENIFYSILQASGYAKIAMKISLYGVIIKLLTMSILCFFKTGIYALIISEIINIIFVITTNIIILKKKNLI